MRDARLKVEQAEAGRRDPLSVDDILFQDSEVSHPINIGDIVLQPKLVNRLAVAWRSLPSASRAKISGSRPRTRKAISKSKTATAINLSKNEKDCLALWKTSRSEFLQRNDVFRFDHQKRPLAQVYNLLCALDRSHVVNQILRRILAVVIHRLGRKLCTRLHGKALHHMTLKISQSGLVEENHQSILTKLNTWANAGARYDTLAKDLGGLGALILLPDDICPST